MEIELQKKIFSIFQSISVAHLQEVPDSKSLFYMRKDFCPQQAFLAYAYDVLRNLIASERATQ
jgi:hypothetical protein